MQIHGYWFLIIRRTLTLTCLFLSILEHITLGGYFALACSASRSLEGDLALLSSCETLGARNGTGSISRLCLISPRPKQSLALRRQLVFSPTTDECDKEA